MTVNFTVNGTHTTLEVSGAKRLLDVLRDELALLGTKEGCGKGECGACSVLIDGRVVNSCLVPVAQVDGKAIITIEGLEESGECDRIQKAFIDAGAVQCGFCIPGMIIAAKALLNENPHPTREEIVRGLSGNLCRCTGYTKIVDAVEAAAK